MINPVANEMMVALVSAVPFANDEELNIVELGPKGGPFFEAVQTRWPRATLANIERDIAALDWWDRMFGADLVVASSTLNQLSDARKQYLYKAAGERLSPRGVLLVGDRVQSQHPQAAPPAAGTHPSALFHHLVWLKHAGFAAVDCFWLREGHAVFGGLKQAGA